MAAGPVNPDATERWLARRPRPDARARVLCFNSAGAGGVLFNRWNDAAAGACEFLGVALPGRELRFSEPAIGDVRELVASMIPALAPLCDRPFMLFGHSYGALVAFELARALRARGLRPVGLFVASRPAPHIEHGYRPVYHLAEADLLDALRVYGGTDEALLNDRAAMRVFLTAIRADLKANYCYAYVEEPPFDFPIVAIHGETDPVCTLDEIEAWRAQTTVSFEVWRFPVGHFVHRLARDQIAARIIGTMDAFSGAAKAESRRERWAG